MSYELMLRVTLGKVLNSQSFCYSLNRGYGVSDVEGLGICKVRTVSSSAFLALLSFVFAVAVVPSLVYSHLESTPDEVGQQKNGNV